MSLGLAAYGYLNRVGYVGAARQSVNREVAAKADRLIVAVWCYR